MISNINEIVITNCENIVKVFPSIKNAEKN